MLVRTRRKKSQKTRQFLYIYDGLNGNKTFEIDEDETVTKLRKKCLKRSFDRVKPRVERNGEVLYRLRGRVCDWSL